MVGSRILNGSAVSNVAPKSKIRNVKEKSLIRVPLSWWEGVWKRVLESHICKLTDANVVRSRKFGKHLKRTEENRILSVTVACAEVSRTMGVRHAVLNSGYNCRQEHNNNSGSVFAKPLVCSRTP